MKLNLDVNDSTVTDYLKGFEEKERPEKAVEAMRLGIHAIRAANPALDASVVERAFASAQERIASLVAQAEKDVRTQLSSQFQTAFGDHGQFQGLLGSAFGDNGTVRALLNKTLGPGSDFWNKLDPGSRTGLLAGIEKAVQTSLDTVIESVKSQMSLDEPASAVSRLRNTIEQENTKLRESVTALVGEVQRIVGKEEGKAEEAQFGVGKGMKFEDQIYEILARQAKGFGDLSESTQGSTGTIPRSKIGDAIITLGESFTTAPGARIVFEFKMAHGYKFKDALDEVALARRNRNAAIGVMVFARGYEPPEIGSFRKVGDAIFCSVDEKEVAEGKNLIAMEAAYAVARGLAVSLNKSGEGINIAEALRTQVEGIVSLAQKLTEIQTKAQTVRNSGDAIADLAKNLYTDLQGRITALQALVKTGEQSAAAA
jgi:hypothetical protein